MASKESHPTSLTSEKSPSGSDSSNSQEIHADDFVEEFKRHSRSESPHAELLDEMHRQNEVRRKNLIAKGLPDPIAEYEQWRRNQRPRDIEAQEFIEVWGNKEKSDNLEKVDNLGAVAVAEHVAIGISETEHDESRTDQGADIVGEVADILEATSSSLGTLTRIDARLGQMASKTGVNDQIDQPNGSAKTPELGGDSNTSATILAGDSVTTDDKPNDAPPVVNGGNETSQGSDVIPAGSFDDREIPRILASGSSDEASGGRIFNLIPGSSKIPVDEQIAPASPEIISEETDVETKLIDRVADKVADKFWELRFKHWSQKYDPKFIEDYKFHRNHQDSIYRPWRDKKYPSNHEKYRNSVRLARADYERRRPPREPHLETIKAIGGLAVDNLRQGVHLYKTSFAELANNGRAKLNLGETYATVNKKVLAGRDKFKTSLDKLLPTARAFNSNYLIPAGEFARRHTKIAALGALAVAGGVALYRSGFGDSMEAVSGISQYSLARAQGLGNYVLDLASEPAGAIAENLHLDKGIDVSDLQRPQGAEALRNFGHKVVEVVATDPNGNIITDANGNPITIPIIQDHSNLPINQPPQTDIFGN